VNLARPQTEQHRRELLDLDLRPTRELVELMTDDQHGAVEAVRVAADAITAAVDAVVERLASADGRLIYVGAGTAGRLGLLDASECPPTFDTDRVVAVIAGGSNAFTNAEEAAEDDAAAARADLDELNVTAADAVVGIAASGRTPYTIGAVTHANALGALTLGVSSNPDAELSRHVHHPIELVSGPELLAGSTRLKAGTAQKVFLNTLSTLVMVRLGKTFGNLMVDVRANNEKLKHRARQIVQDATGCDAGTAARHLDTTGGEVKAAIVSLLADVDPDEAARRLDASGGRVRAALEA
jgi:N-acetylmuramic acid 6-phosphate etherase